MRFSRVILGTRIFTAVILLLFLMPTTTANEPHESFVKPNPIDLQTLISPTPASEMVHLERADAADPYRSPGKGVVVNPWFINGTNNALITVTPFPNFSLIPSFLRTSGEKIGAFSATLEPCFSSTQVDCISEFSVNEDGETLRARPFAEIPNIKVLHSVFRVGFYSSATEKFSSFPGDSDLGYPSGGRSWLWKFDGDEKLYVAAINFSGSFSTPNEKNPWLYYPKVQVQIVPVDIEKPICTDPTSGGCTWSNYEYGKDGAIFSNEEISIKRSLFSKDGPFSLKFHTTIPWNTWMVGTVTDLKLDFKQSGKTFEYSVSGRPSRISSARKSVELTEANYKELLDLSEGSSAGAEDCPKSPSCSPFINIGGSNYATADTFKRLERVEEFTDKKSTHSVKAWLLTSSLGLGGNDARYTSVMKCVDSSKLKYPAGASSSNATVFEQSPPLWDSQDRTFTYQVGAFHFKSDGTKEVGDYSFLISKKIADCLWGGEISPSSIRVEIVNGDITSSVISSANQDNTSWVRFRASGFHFSSPKFVMRQVNGESNKSQSRQEELGESSNQVIEKVQPTTVTIRCVKGKRVKTVTGISPKCPKGFKKK